jgi:hypothetical protein
MKTTIKFNTERQYSPKGQRIAARILECGAVVFVDIDRGIDGVIAPLVDHETTALCFDQRYVMGAYDTGAYAELFDFVHSTVARELRRAFDPAPVAPAPYATMKSTGERVQILAPYKKGFLVFVEGWAHNVEVSANDLVLDAPAAPAAPVLTDAEPEPAPEPDYPDGVESHDYVVTGCHDEDNTKPEPAIQAITYAHIFKRRYDFQLVLTRNAELSNGILRTEYYGTHRDAMKAAAAAGAVAWNY